MDCLSNIIGIIETPTVELPNVTTSDSGLWLEDTTTGRIPVEAAFYNNTDVIDNIIPEAINEAVKELRKYSEDRLLRVYSTVSSTIGFARDWSTFLAADAGYYYIWLDPKLRKGGIFTLNEINIHTENGLHTGQIEIYRGEEVIYSGLQSAFTSMTIELTDTIFIAYQGDRPRDFKHSACCGRARTHMNYVSVGSGTVSSLVFPGLNNLPISDYCNGIEVKGVFDCDAFSFLCGFNYTRTSFGQVFAKLVQQIARKNIAYWLLTNNKLTAYSTCKKEEINTILEYLIDDIETMLLWLPENYDYSDCYRCNGIAKGEIII